MIDYKKVAGERLQKIRTLERRIDLARQDIERKAKRAIETAIHNSCLASLSDERVRVLIDDAVKRLVRDLNFDKEV